MQNPSVHVRHEVWVSANEEAWRFNACFDSLAQAITERSWYMTLPGYRVELRVRTSRYQQPWHRTSGGSTRD